MARRFQRRRWRRPQRLTLEAPPPVRRKDVTVPELLTVEPHLVWQDNRRRMAALLLAFLGLAAAEGLLVGVAVGAPVVAVAGVALAVLYLVVGARFGDGWMQAVLGAREPQPPVPLTANLLEGLARAAQVPAPQLLVCPGDAPNALALGLRRRWVAVTRGALELGLLEQEALLAHEVTHIASGDAALAAAFVLLGGAPELGLKALGARRGPLALLALPLWPACLLLRGLGGVLLPRDREHRADVAGALLTRYPPGMQKLLRAASVEHSDSPLRATGPFWTAPRVPSGGLSLERRAELVAEM